MLAFHSFKLKALGLAAAIAVTGGTSSAAPPKGQLGNGGPGGGAFKPAGGLQPSGGFKPPMQNGGGPKIDPVFSNGPKGNNGLPKIDPIFSNGPKNGGVNPGNGGIKPGNGNGGPKIDPGKGNGPINGNGPKIDPGKGNGPFGNGMAGKPWLQKPGNGMQKTIFCKTPCPKDYCFKFGVKGSYGYCYKGYDHCHWHCRRWSDVHSCWFFYDPCCLAWYYWCEPDLCYYPCTHVPYKTFVCAAPVAPVVTTPVVTTYVVPTPTYYYVTPTYYVVPQTYYTPTQVVATAPAVAPVAGPANVVAATGPVAAGAAAPAGGGMTLPPLPGE